MFQDTSTPAGSVPPAADAAAVAAPTLGTNSNAAALKEMGFSHLIQNYNPANPNFDLDGAIVIVTLCLFSIMSIYWIVLNLIRNTAIRSRMNSIMRTFWETPSAQEAIRFMEEQPASEPFSKIALDCASAAAHHQRHEGSRLVEALTRSVVIDRALRQAVARESGRLEGGLTVLATVGSTGPFVGLLGTVWGIYHALIRISASGDASMSAVAGPVGEALIMTAFGLFVAIPAVLAYNFFVRSNRVILARFDEFAHDLHDFFATGSRVEAGAAAPARTAAPAAPAARK